MNRSQIQVTFELLFNLIHKMNSRNRRMLKIALLGDAGVGKSSILKQYAEHEFSMQYKATIGTDFTSKQLDIDGEIITLQIWDTAGQERFQSLGPSFYRGTDILIIVYDVTRPSTFENINKWRAEFNSQMGLSDSNDFPILILGNKSDSPKKSVQTSVATEFAKNNENIVFYEVSAYNSNNISAAFEDIVRKALKKIKEKEEKGELQPPTTVIYMGDHQETEEKKTFDKIFNYIRFLEERLSKYEKVEPIDIDSFSKVIAMYNIKVGPKNNKKKAKSKEAKKDKAENEDIVSKLENLKRRTSETKSDDSYERESDSDDSDSLFDDDEIECKIDIFDRKSTKEQFDMAYVFLISYAHHLEERLGRHENLNQVNFKTFKKYVKKFKTSK